MKSYKLNICDNGHRIGFIYNNMESLNARYERALQAAKQLNKEQQDFCQQDSEKEYVLEVVFR